MGELQLCGFALQGISTQWLKPSGNKLADEETTRSPVAFRRNTKQPLSVRLRLRRLQENLLIIGTTDTPIWDEDNRGSSLPAYIWSPPSRATELDGYFRPPPRNGASALHLTQLISQSCSWPVLDPVITPFSSCSPVNFVAPEEARLYSARMWPACKIEPQDITYSMLCKSKQEKKVNYTHGCQRCECLLFHF